MLVGESGPEIHRKSSVVADDPKSIHELEPLEVGGTAARRGFLFQDHVAARFCLEMLLSENLTAVWCETLDDVTLVWEEGGREQVEFVQVKAEQLEQLWSVAKLCEREGGRVGTSVLEKLLANDRCTEPCRFRVVTRRPPRGELKLLEADLEAEVRHAGSERAQKLCQALEEKLSDVESPNGHGLAWWVERTAWNAEHSEDSLRNGNLKLLARLVEESGRYLASDQREQLYDLVLMKVKGAADADKSLDRHAGKLRREDMVDWFAEQIQVLERGGSEAGGRSLTEKLASAGIAPDTIRAAQELRRSYLGRWIRPSYLEGEDSRAWEDKVRARLVGLRAALDSGEISESGVEFHNRTLKALEKLRTEAPKHRLLPEEFFLGCMYYITDVCQHRFLRAEV